MSTTDKTITISHVAWIATISAVMTVMRDLRRTIGGRPVAPEFMEYLIRDVAINTEALTALNAATILTREETHGALEGENLRTAIEAMHFMLLCWGVIGQGGSLTEAVRDARYNPRGKVMPSADDLNAALLFLESPK